MVLTCRKCHKVMTVEPEDEGVTWYRRARGYSYHKQCWDEHVNTEREKTAEDWLDLIFDLITRELNSTYEYHKIKAQADNFCTKGQMTMKGIYFACYYFFLVRGQAYKPEYGIGIVPHIYEDAANYWLEQEKKKKDILKEILRIQEIEQQTARKVNAMKRGQRKITAMPTFDDIQ